MDAYGPYGYVSFRSVHVTHAFNDVFWNLVYPLDVRRCQMFSKWVETTSYHYSLIAGFMIRWQKISAVFTAGYSLSPTMMIQWKIAMFET